MSLGTVFHGQTIRDGAFELSELLRGWLSGSWIDAMVSR